MMAQRTNLLIALFVLVGSAHAFQTVKSPSSSSSKSAVVQKDRRDFLHHLFIGPAAAALGVATGYTQQPALASGGATAGGAYLLSAKQRYNERVGKGVAGFLALGSFLEEGNIDGLRNYFATEEVGGWKDLTAAGYLLANAFRRNSTAAPDSLPSVQVNTNNVAF